MPLSLLTNLSSLYAQRALLQATSALAVNSQRIATGLRVNSAADDPAGIAIASRFEAQIRGSNQAIQNASIASSLSQTADDALASITGLVQDVRDLALAASNGTATPADRASYQAQADSLLAQIDQVVSDTSFNGRKLLDGSFTSTTFIVGPNGGSTISLSLGNESSNVLGAQAVIAGGVVASSPLAIGELTINGTSIRATSNQDDTKSTVSNSASAIAKAAAINDAAGTTGVTATVNASSVNAGVDDVDAGSIAAGRLVINGVDIGAVTVLQGDSDSALRNAINAVSGATGVTATLNASNALVLTAADGRNLDVVIGPGPTGGITGLATATTFGRITLSSDSAITVGGTTPGDAGLVAGTTNVNFANAISNIDLSSQAGATSALTRLDAALDQLGFDRGTVGATINRLSSTVDRLTANVTNLEAARGAIVDADVARESALFSRNQILLQSAAYVLAQANVSSGIALTLLGAPLSR